MIKKIALFIFVSVVVLSLSGIAGASMMIPASDKAKEHAKAPEKSPVIGENWDLERVDFIHYARPNKPGKGRKTNACYKLLGVKWRELAVDYIINPSNPFGLTESFVTSAISTSAETWDSETSAELLNDNYGVDYELEYGTQDYKNAIVFDDYPNDGVIGVTSIWYTRRGKRIVEFDILLNTRFDWGDGEANPAIMDVENIMTHELGHGLGLGDIYNDTCSAVTMFGYSTEGDVEKRSLETSDITGLQAMYGM